ncbi:hypothetical protein OY671_007362, partial [Metschnikowia pulcherrima]
FIETDENHENVHNEKRSSPLFEESAKRVEQKIVCFLKTMRIFVSNTSFDYLGFESQIEEYRNDLADIEFTVENSPQFENRIGAQLEFAKHLFWVLVATTEKMKRYGQSRLPGHSLVFEMMHINVCAMLLLNAHAELDISIDGYFKKLRLLHEAYTFLMEKYDLMGSKQAHMRIFEIQALQTKHNLETLSSSSEVSRYIRIKDGNTLLFQSSLKANKHQIKAAVKALYEVDVEKINTMIRLNRFK